MGWRRFARAVGALAFAGAAVAESPSPPPPPPLARECVVRIEQKKHECPSPKRICPALERLRCAALAGDDEAAFALGRAYRDSTERLLDAYHAADWFRVAAEKGHAGAQAALGWLHSLGEGAAHDSGEALRWNRLAAAQNGADGQRNLGFFYFWGVGVKKDKDQAARWHQLAAAQGQAQSQYSLGWMRARGDGLAARQCFGVDVVFRGRGGGSRSGGAIARRNRRKNVGGANRARAGIGSGIGAELLALARELTRECRAAN